MLGVGGEELGVVLAEETGVGGPLLELEEKMLAREELVRVELLEEVRRCLGGEGEVREEKAREGRR